MNKTLSISPLLCVVILATPLPTSAAQPQRSITEEDGLVEIIAINPPVSQPAAKEAKSVVIPATWTLRQLVRRHTESFERKEKDALLKRIGTTKPASLKDLRALLNLYDRGAPETQLHVQSSLDLLSPADSAFAPFFMALVENGDAKLQIYAIAGLVRLGHRAAEPRLRKIASAEFKHREPTLLMMPTDNARWRAQFEALRALAIWDREEALKAGVLPLLLKKSAEAPPVAGLAARYYWEKGLKRFVRWAESKSELDRRRAAFAWRTRVPRGDLRETVGLLRGIVLDRRKNPELRHQASVKLGLAADADEVALLLKERKRSIDEQTRLLLTAALFASRDPRAIPILVEYVKTNPSPASRAGALTQLRGMMPKKKYGALLEWVIDNDTDRQVRAAAMRGLETLD